MKAILKPLLFGIVAYIVLIVIFYITSNSMNRILNRDIYLIYHFIGLAIPLLISGYIGAKFTDTSYRWLKILFGMTCGLIGFAFNFLITKSNVETKDLVIVVSLVIVVTYIGSFLGSKSKNVL